ncbi:hypothetical protein DERF_014577 [Dermatophagoides farinae]|uniref:Uncharacterized protein n=1 Tax=Dermatophagoides farinae TaxID=6954 RepID=A0A922HIN7_DERFA|nr:hypothetical protein DERF_014577 [Dermatophagoides farinae]
MICQAEGWFILNDYVPYTFQQNGKIERRNRTLMECARTLWKDSKLPDEFWHLSVNCANYLLNRWPTKNHVVPMNGFMQ